MKFDLKKFAKTEFPQLKPVWFPAVCQICLFSVDFYGFRLSRNSHFPRLPGVKVLFTNPNNKANFMCLLQTTCLDFRLNTSPLKKITWELYHKQ